MIGWIIIGALVFIAVCVFAWALCSTAAARTPFEQEREDEMQAEYLRKWDRQHR